MIPEYVAQIAMALDALRIHGNASYSWYGVQHRVLPNRVRSLLDEQDLRSCLLSAVEARLYEHFYSIGGLDSEVERLHFTSSEAATARFIRSLSDANYGSGHFDPGWCVLARHGNSVTITKDGLRFVADAGDCESDAPLIQGMNVSLRTAKECFRMTPGFYLVLGNAPGPVHGSSDCLVRLYWNVTAEGAVPLVRDLTQLLNDRNINFRLKTLRNPAAYQRCDAAVLYFSKSALFSVWDGLEETYVRLSEHLRTSVPAMTKPLAPGLGLAEDPAASTSFGLHRCGLIAEGAVSSAKARAAERRLQSVRERFAREGLDMDHPYLGPGSKDVYPTITPSSKVSRASGASNAERSELLEAAVSVGRALSDCAVFGDGEACTWVGYRAMPSSADSARASWFGSIGPCLYDGNSGVAWLLSELYTLTHDEELGRCAAAATRAAIASAHALPSSLFSGWMGVAVSAAYVARNLRSLELRDASVELLNRLDDCGQTFGSDLLSGRAGIVVGLLLLKTLLPIDGLAEVAAAQGQLLIEDAEKSHIGGRAWRSDRGPARSSLTGLSHGASGVALALTRLSEATGRSEFMDVARKEVLYERSLFNPFYRNWPDLRGVRSRARKPEHQYRFPTYWCYGAPGIGVSRTAAWRHTRQDDYLEEARVALRSTFDWTSRAFAQNSELGCLCHGILGNALVLKDADTLGVPSDAAEQRDLPRVIAGQVARSILDEKTLFGTSVKNVDVPSLMLGFAGVGHYMLSFIDDPAADRFVSPLSLSTRSEDPP
jgi:hypothetical protein